MRPTPLNIHRNCLIIGRCFSNSDGDGCDFSCAMTVALTIAGCPLPGVLRDRGAKYPCPKLAPPGKIAALHQTSQLSGYTRQAREGPRASCPCPHLNHSPSCAQARCDAAFV